MATFFTSDTHFGDPRGLRIDRRPYRSVAEHDAVLVARWNETVAAEDEVWHLGDFARTSKLAAAILPELNGRKHLIVGNNDPEPSTEHGWAGIAPYAEVQVDGVDLVLCHYPFRSWNRMHKGAVNLHGHSHGRMPSLPRQFDVGVDVRDYRPVTLGELLSTARAGRTKRAP